MQNFFQNKSKLILKQLGSSLVHSFSYKPIPLDPKTTRIGWCGTGVMGLPMCEHLMDGGFKNCVVYNRTHSRTEPLLKKGAKLAKSPLELAKQTDIIFSCVSFPSDVRNIYLGKEGILQVEDQQPRIVIDMTTSEPTLAKYIYEKGAEKNISSLDAPISGGDVGARNGTLAIFAAGDKLAYENIEPLLNLMGKNVTYCGDSGKGQFYKIANQIAIASNLIGMVESLIYSYKAGLDPSLFINAIKSGAAASFSLSNHTRRILKDDLEPGCYVDYFVKDLGIALKEAEKLNLSLPGLSLAHSLFVALSAQGYGKKGTQALIRVLESMNNIKIVK
eukprot:Anaeramoba_ignava/a481557_179.p1 GENE.a481557_179~~a481557_179.p1  ORF type:complete len:332 (+),score=83.89 a481557_179:132-1127(+)